MVQARKWAESTQSSGASGNAARIGNAQIPPRHVHLSTGGARLLGLLYRASGAVPIDEIEERFMEGDFQCQRLITMGLAMLVPQASTAQGLGIRITGFGRSLNDSTRRHAKPE